MRDEGKENKCVKGRIRIGKQRKWNKKKRNKQEGNEHGISYMGKKISMKRTKQNEV